LKLAKKTDLITTQARWAALAVTLCLSVLLHQPALAQLNLGGSTPTTLNPLSEDPTDTASNRTPRNNLPSAMPNSVNTILGDKVPDGGWDGLAKLLEALAPSVDTSIPLTPTEISNRIDALIRAGRFKEALQSIESRQAVEALRHTPGTDVQLMFLHARILAEMNRPAESEAVYLQMTTRFPELPEPWNNLAALYVKRNELDQARRALEMAIMINPKYSIAQANLGDVQMNLALRAYQNAAQAGVPGLAPKIKRVKELLEGSAK
jgi:tetratricopeptide (TPR) repeat protein